MSEHDCIFCRIASGELPSIPLFEDSQTKAFMDINPVARGHALVISKEHAETIYDISPAALAAVSATAQRVAQAVNRALAPEGLSIIQNNGAGAAQSVAHYHLHVLPRSSYDDLTLNWRLTPGDRRGLEETAQLIRAAF
jgi:histidine triad (HIT) family protein